MVIHRGDPSRFIGESVTSSNSRVRDGTHGLSSSMIYALNVVIYHSKLVTILMDIDG